MFGNPQVLKAGLFGARDEIADEARIDLPLPEDLRNSYAKPESTSR
jgi:hypothetical protein